MIRNILNRSKYLLTQKAKQIFETANFDRNGKFSRTSHIEINACIPLVYIAFEERPEEFEY